MITQSQLQELLHYNENTGIFTWRQKTSHASRIQIGDIAGSVDSKGYICVGINNKRYKAHRLAWLYINGEWPQNHIDHINGITNDNRIENLRNVTHRQNHQNRKEHRNGILIGATYSKYKNKWQAQIQINGKLKHIGYYNSELEAHEAYAAVNWFLSEVEKL